MDAFVMPSLEGFGGFDFDSWDDDDEEENND
jgi:ribosome-associated heat shock protein Hsp15